MGERFHGFLEYFLAHQVERFVRDAAFIHHVDSCLCFYYVVPDNLSEQALNLLRYNPVVTPLNG